MLKVTANMRKNERLRVWDSPAARLQDTLLHGGVTCTGSGSWEDFHVDRNHLLARTADTLSPRDSSRKRGRRIESVFGLTVDE